MFSNFSGLVDRFTTFMREPMYNLGNSISEYIYSSSIPDKSYLQDFVNKVNETCDPDVLEEVWFVLAKAIDSDNNDYICSALQVCDVLIKHCGCKFHNSCTPLFMRRLKDLIQSKTAEGGAKNMKVVNDAKTKVHEWGEAFLPIASQGRGKVIVEGYQDMINDGICFPASTEPLTWKPLLSPVSNECNERNERNERNESESDRSEFDVKKLYSKAKKLLIKLEEDGPKVFEDKRAEAIATECNYYLPDIKQMCENCDEEDTNTKEHLEKLIEYISSIETYVTSYKNKTAQLSWSDDDDDDDDIWNEDEKEEEKKREKEKKKKEEEEERNRYLYDNLNMHFDDFLLF